MQIEKAMEKKTSKSEKTSKNIDVLPKVLAETLKLLKINPTHKYVVRKTGKDKRLVTRDLKRLVDKGFIKWIDKGVYKILKDGSHLLPRHQESGVFRLHHLQVQLLINKDNQQFIKNTIIRNSHNFNVRTFGKAGHIFDLDVTGTVTDDNLYFSFKPGFELVAKDTSELFYNMYNIIEETAKKWERRFNIPLFKDNRVNIIIKQVHVAYIEKGLVKEFEKINLKRMIIKDDDDGKWRFVIDMSKGFPEWEAVHPTKALNDTVSMEHWANTIKNGKYQENLEKSEEFFKGVEGVTLKDLVQCVSGQTMLMDKMCKMQGVNNEQMGAVIVGMKALTTNLNNLIILNTPKDNSAVETEDINSSVPNYIG